MSNSGRVDLPALGRPADAQSAAVQDSLKTIQKKLNENGFENEQHTMIGWAGAGSTLPMQPLGDVKSRRWLRGVSFTVTPGIAAAGFGAYRIFNVYHIAYPSGDRSIVATYTTQDRAIPDATPVFFDLENKKLFVPADGVGFEILQAAGAAPAVVQGTLSLKWELAK